MRMRRALIALLATLALAATGCSSFTGIYDLPLPGGADLGEDPIRVKIQFRDVLDLVPQTHVKVNEVPVGRVEKIDLADDGWHAEVTVLLRRDADMPANSLANIKQSSLLGEKYIDLVHPPRGTARGELTDGSVIPLSRTNRNVEVEEILGALSMLLNGGGIEQVNTITKELNKTLTGNEPEIKALLHNANTLVRGLNGQTDDIDRALHSLNRLSKTLRKDKHVVAKALDDLSPGMKVLVDQRKDLTRMLKSLRKLSEVATDTLQRSQDDLIDNLESLRPILQNLADAEDLPQSLELLVSFPFSDGAVEGAKGDYLNLFARVSLDLEEIVKNFRRNRGHPMPGLPIVKDLPMAEGELLDPNQLPLPDLEVPQILPEIPMDGSGPRRLIESLTGALPMGGH